ncbi:MAG: hypothetical protein IH835_00175 [Proteobacteria bacterium]|nr:hypothetical protein [Pseudomonadota bacterium]
MHSEKLEQLVRERAAEIVETRDVTVFALAKLAESRDPETGEHLERMRSYSQILAEELAKTGPYTVEIDEAFLARLAADEANVASQRAACKTENDPDFETLLGDP